MQMGTLLAATDAPFERLQALDRELARCARKSGSLRLAMGLGLDALARTSGHTALGFASIEAYALERCERSATWTRESRRLATRMQRVPLVREALISGRIGWSLALELVKVATAEDETQWLQISGSCTVARFRALVKELKGEGRPPDDPATAEEDDEHCLLTVTADREETWLLECTKMIFRHIEGGTTSDMVEALVAEASTSLMALLPKDAEDPNDLAPSYEAQNAWNRQLAKYREEAERLCESRVSSQKDEGLEPEISLEDAESFIGSPDAIDRALRRISASLAERDVIMGELAEKFWKADGWRRLGYATAAQYARERLGTGLTSLKDKRQLARELRRLPHVQRTLRDGDIGYEAARVVARIAAPETDAAWADRARRRTVVHLREDVRAAEFLSRTERRELIEPPSVEAVTKVRALETAVVTGALFDGPVKARDAKAALASLWAEFTEARHAPSHVRSRARDTVRLRVRPEIRAQYRGVERLYARHLPRPMSFLQFACLTFIKTWARKPPPVAYGDIYARDGSAARILRARAAIARRTTCVSASMAAATSLRISPRCASGAIWKACTAAGFP